VSKQLSDRRQSVEVQVAFYETQAQLARMGLNTRRSVEFYERQIAYFRSELR
jgi:hypothetical protein